MLHFKKIISISLIIFLLTSVLPVTVRADQVTASNQVNKHKAIKKKDKKKKVGKITKELTDERTKNSKRYQKDDGSYEVAEYKTPIHYLDNGKWKDIDNSLQDSKDDGYLENKQNDFKIEIAKNSSTQKLVDLKKDKYEVSWNLDNANAAQGSVVTPNDNELDDDINKSADNEIKNDADLSAENVNDKQAAKDILVSNEKVKTLKNITSTVDFANIFANTDLQYILNGSDVKENIVINKPSDNAVYKFNLNAKNVTPVLQQDKSIIFYDSNDKTKAVFKIAAPVM